MSRCIIGNRSLNRCLDNRCNRCLVISLMRSICISIWSKRVGWGRKRCTWRCRCRCIIRSRCCNCFKWLLFCTNNNHIIFRFHFRNFSRFFNRGRCSLNRCFLNNWNRCCLNNRHTFLDSIVSLQVSFLGSSNFRCVHNRCRCLSKINLNCSTLHLESIGISNVLNSLRGTIDINIIVRSFNNSINISDFISSLSNTIIVTISITSKFILGMVLGDHRCIGNSNYRNRCRCSSYRCRSYIRSRCNCRCSSNNWSWLSLSSQIGQVVIVGCIGIVWVMGRCNLRCNRCRCNIRSRCCSYIRSRCWHCLNILFSRSNSYSWSRCYW